MKRYVVPVLIAVVFVSSGALVAFTSLTNQKGCSQQSVAGIPAPDSDGNAKKFFKPSNPGTLPVAVNARAVTKKPVMNGAPKVFISI